MSDIENKILKLIKERKNIFIHGRAGTGKSTLLKNIKKAIGKNVVVVAPTGISALNISGQTIHSFFKLPIGYLDSKVVGNLNEYQVYMLQTLSVLIIDEVSMVRSDVLDAIDMTLRNARGNFMPFGGVRVLMFGDTAQLPAVVKGEDKQFFENDSHVFYNSNAYKQGEFTMIELTHVYRQSDPFLLDVLSDIRHGVIDPTKLEEFNSKVHISRAPKSDKSVVLAATNNLVHRINQIKFAQIQSEPKTYVATVDNFKESEFPTQQDLQLKVGAKVVTLINDMEKRFVNGSVGTVLEMKDDCIYVDIDGEACRLEPYNWEKSAYKVKGGQMVRETIGTFKQIPVKLAYSLTVHRAQGLTLDELHLDLSVPMFEQGQLYVALSRVKSLEGLSISRPLTMQDLMENRCLTNLKEAAHALQ